MTQKDEAQRFPNTMVGGHLEYGAVVSPHKTLTNFKTGITGVRTISTNWFPFCGISIHTHNLGVPIDMSRIKDHAPTVEYSRTPFKTLSKNLVTFLKANSRPIFFDPTLNSASIIIKNIYDIFTLSARKLHETVTSLKRTNPQAWKFGAMKTMIEGLFVALYQIIRTYISQLTCGSKLLHWIDKKAVRNLGAEAYLKVLKAKQTSYNPSFLKWLENMKVL